jgi:hypothetical protein
MTVAKERIGTDADARILEVCAGLSMPQALRAPFADRLKAANYVHFGFEQRERSCIHKVYMEYWTTWREELEAKRRTEPFIGGYGYKWDPASEAASALTRYVCHPLLAPLGMLERVARLCGPSGGALPAALARGLLEAAATRIPVEKMLYLEADEEGSSRRSFDINLLQAGLTLAELEPLWTALCRHYGLDMGTFGELLRPVRSQRFAHIQGGVDRDGRGFVTIYYGVEEH